MVGTMYIYTCVGLSALLVSTYREERRPTSMERVTELAPRSLYMYANNNIPITNRRKGAIGKKDLYMKNLVTLRFMLISLFAAMSMVMNAETVSYKTDDGFKYKLDTETKTAELSGCRISAIEVVIPASVTYNDVSFTVTSLGAGCFKFCSSLTSVTIPDSVTSLGNMCFFYCI